ncbi:hypothetical protein JNUCC0626_04895 [Lentzea sp. JNUCC 0626]|uniref:hypothetical protein n=1 Tax=Lentzea sp. JNUCC 0626 TaxID=3367513 RepID=UPI00374A5708
MRQKRVLAGAVSLTAALSLAVAPQAAAADCVYNRVDLPLPAGTTNAEVEGSSTNNSRIVGSYWAESRSRAALWVNSTLRVLPQATEPFRDVFPEGVNNTSVVVGRQEWRSSPNTGSQAFRYENNTYTFLETAADENSRASHVNDNGDVLGEAWKKSNPNERTVVLWPRGGARKSFGVGYPMGISAQRKLAVSYDRDAWIVDGDTGARTQVPGGSQPMVIDNERLLGYEFLGVSIPGVVSEWDLNGVKVNEYRGGLQAYGKNNSGTVFGTIRPEVGGGPTLWRTNSRMPVLADRLPTSFYGDVTDAATLISSYRNDVGETRPARWLWVCS